MSSTTDFPPAADAELIQRKRAHLQACLDASVECPDRAWEMWQLRPECFPELALDQVNLRREFLGHSLSFPFLIGAMTGGGGALWNRQLAQVAQSQGVGLSLGSMRAAVVNPGLADEFDVKSLAPDVPVLGNVGVWELRQASFVEALLELSHRLSLDALVVHVNPAQELVQSAGERDFNGALDALEAFVQASPVPVLLKEVGMGLSTRHLPRLMNVGLYALDMAGKGGTHFVRVEATRAPADSLEALHAQVLSNWGRSTPDVLVEWSRAMRVMPVMGTAPLLIASGGVRNSLQMATAFALGADLVSAARPLWVALHQSGAQAVETWLKDRRNQLRAVCLLCGAQTPAALRGLAQPATSTAPMPQGPTSVGA